VCLICIEYQKEKLSFEEVISNLQEIRDTISEEHEKEIYEMLWEDMCSSSEYDMHGNGD